MRLHPSSSSSSSSDPFFHSPHTTHHTSDTYAEDSACTQVPDWQTYNGTCLHVLGGEIKLSAAANIVTTFEFLQVCI